ncbi:MAG: NADH:flavin oxidoreductase [Peptococcaceae bacterium]|nr:NADH:flavin oxidoreductase [Peptococcaceae bacterium]
MLYEPFAIGAARSMVVKNRFVRSATHDFMGNMDGSLSDREFDLYRTLAAHDLGLIITGHSYVLHPEGRIRPGQNAIYDDSFIEGYRKLARIVHKYGAKLVLQISHAGRQVDTLTKEDNWMPVAPSPVTNRVTGITPREMTEGEILQWIEAYAAAMARAKAAGCDGVQLHIAHGYGLSQFISPYTNRRRDRWGGSLENRTRILREIMSRGRRLVGDDFPVLAKLNTTDGFDGPEYLTLEDAVAVARILESCGVDAIEVSGGMKEAGDVMSRKDINSQEQEAYFKDAARAIKATVSIPVILVGGLRSLSVMESLVTSGVADIVSLCRPLIREPDLISRFRKGQAKSACRSCNACFNHGGIQCPHK